jgi:hypothetical protein
MHFLTTLPWPTAADRVLSVARPRGPKRLETRLIFGPMARLVFNLDQLFFFCQWRLRRARVQGVARGALLPGAPPAGPTVRRQDGPA